MRNASRRNNGALNGKECTLTLQRKDMRLLMLSAGNRLDALVRARAAGQITGAELDRRIDRWRQIIAKIDKCISE